MKIKLKKYHPSDLEYAVPLSDKKAKDAWRVLLSSKKFYAYVKAIRASLLIPEIGLAKIKERAWIDTADIKDISNAVEKIIEVFKLHPTNSWYFPIMHFVLTNETFAPILSEFDIRIENKKNPVVILEVSNRLNKKEFIDIINNSWEEISSLMQDLPRIETKKITVLAIAKQVYDMKKKRMKYKEIADLLEKMHPDDNSGKYNEDYVKTLYHRYKRFFE